MQSKKIESFEIGMSAQRELVVSKEIVQAYADLSGDYNPIHLDENYAKTTRFHGCIAHGGIAAAVISSVLGNDLPGAGCVFLQQNLQYLRPVRIGDRISAHARIVEIKKNKNRITLAVCVKNQKDEVVIDGQALMLLLED